MKKNYNVLWFDDEYQTLDIINEKAMLADINLVGYSNAEDGLKELRNNINKYDAVIVDGIFYKSNNELNEQVTQNAMAEVAIQLMKMEDSKKFPWFILSGQASFTKDNNPFADAFRANKVYDKLSNEDIQQLWEDIKEESDKQADTQIRHVYKHVFEACNDKYLGTKAETYLLQIIKKNQTDNTKDTIKSFNALRDIIELLFHKLNYLQLIPDNIFESKGWINGCSKFISNKHDKFIWNEYPIHPTVSYQIYFLLQIVQDASHEVTENLNLKVKDFINQNKTSYLYKSSVFLLLDIIVWFKTFVDEHSDIQQNKLLWKENVPISEQRIVQEPVIDSNSKPRTGIIKQDKNGNYYCNEFLLNYHITQSNYMIGDYIQIIDFQNNENNKTKHIYPKYAIKYCKLINNIE